jgi:hypothetical protein
MPNENKPADQSENALRILPFCFVLGLIAIFTYAAQFQSLREGIAGFAVALMVALSALFCGALIGFLFGIPRTLQQENSGPDRKDSANQTKSSTEMPAADLDYRVNTNLEQISDWLTKILVGVGLIQLGKLPGLLWSLGGNLSSGLGNLPTARVFIICLIAYFTVSGFLYGFLWTRLSFGKAVREADQQMLGLIRKVEVASKKIEEFKSQVDKDAHALAVVRSMLNFNAAPPAMPQDELNKILSEASNSTKAEIFWTAADARQKNWNEPKNKAKMERTIPIFRALIHCDINDEFHMNHGHLGFALKDQRVPDWEAAEAELSKAIQLRGSRAKNGWGIYEFNRAVCLVNLDKDWQHARPSREDRRALILADLAVAAADGWTDVILTEQSLMKWMNLNKISEDMLEGQASAAVTSK